MSEAAGVNSAAGSFGLSFGLAFAGAIMLATLSITFTNEAEASKVLSPAQQQQVADALEDDAQVMSNTRLEELLADEPEATQDEIIRINDDARPIALQVALLIPILAAPPRAVQLVPHDSPAGSEAFEQHRGGGAGLTSQYLVAVVADHEHRPVAMLDHLARNAPEQARAQP